MSEENNKAIAIEADKLIEKELNEINENQKNELINTVKYAIKSVLEKIELKKQEKEKLEEELRILKKDLEDLRSGNFEKLFERQTNSKVAKDMGRNIFNDLDRILEEIKNIHFPYVPYIPQPISPQSPIWYTGDLLPINNITTAGTIDWNNVTGGTYYISTNCNGEIKEKIYYF